MSAATKTKRSLAAHKANWTRKLRVASPALKDERPTAALASCSTALLEATLLDRAIDRTQAEIDRLEAVICALEIRNERRLAERARLRAVLEREKGGAS